MNEFDYVKKNRCDEPCWEAPACRAWVEVKDKRTDADRKRYKEFMRDDKDCPLFKEEKNG